jgi:hypothetical protein
MTWIALCHSTSCNYLANRFAHDAHFWLYKEMSDVLRNERCGQDALWNLGRERKGKERLNGKIYL